MAKRTRYSEYRDLYANYRLGLSDDGILFMQRHTNGGRPVWDWRAHDEMSDVFADIAGDCDYLLMPGTRGLLKLDGKAWYARHLINPRGQVPGDGQHVIWSFLAGHTRARYFFDRGEAQRAGSKGVGRGQ